tara:strand:- start:36 stop:347 length:312 start_codon:yes stop_codon:yes gene_type:complete
MINEDYYLISKEVKKVEHIWSEKNNRWIYIEKDNENNIIGLNFMHNNDYIHFQLHWCKLDKDFTEFYQYCMGNFKHEYNNRSFSSFLNICIDAFNRAKGLNNL